MIFISDAMANAADSTPGGIASFLPLVVICVIFYFLLIRPQQKRIKAHQTLVNELKVNDKVITAGGILGVIKAVDTEHKVITVEIAEATEIKIKQDTISALMDETMIEAVYKKPKKSTKPKSETSTKKTTKAPVKKTSAKK